MESALLPKIKTNPESRLKLDLEAEVIVRFHELICYILCYICIKSEYMQKKFNPLKIQESEEEISHF